MRLHTQRLCAQPVLDKRGRCCSFFLIHGVFSALWIPGAGRHDAAAMAALLHLAGSEGPLSMTIQERHGCAHAKWSLTPTQACEWTRGLCSQLFTQDMETVSTHP